MSFIRKNPYRLLEKSIGVRQELLGFLLLVSIWAVLIGLFTNGLYAIIEKTFGAWIWAHLGWALGAATAGLVVLTILGLSFLSWGITGAMEDVRKFKLVLPMAAGAERVEILEIPGYRVSSSIRRRLQKADGRRLAESYARAIALEKGRPLQGQLHAALMDAVTAGLADSWRLSCEFLLSDDALFHGVDYSALAKPPGACPEADVEGLPGRKMHLPRGCQAAMCDTEPDRYGKTGRELKIEGPFGSIRIAVWPQWAILSPDYHALSLRLVEGLIGTKGYRSHRNPDLPPTLWVLEAPIVIRVHFRNWRKPWFFLRRRFELYAEWADDLIERTIEFWSWEDFVERRQD